MPIHSVWTVNRRAGPDFDGEPPPPPYQQWPALQLGVILDWKGTLPPNPPLAIFDVFNMPWDVEAGRYYASIESGIYTVHVWFYLDISNGNYISFMELMQDDFVHSDVRSNPGTIPVNTKIDLTITTWIGAIGDHVIEVTFRT